MPNRVFIIPRRNDIGGKNIHVQDLRPNSSQRNLIYDGEGQSGYVGMGYDAPAATATLLDAYVSGSRNTSPMPALAADDTTGGGNDVTASATASFGLAAYLRERVHGGGTVLATAPAISGANAVTIAAALASRVEAGLDITLADINTAISATVPNSDLDGTAALSNSFGTVLEVLRILAGEVYRSPRFVIVENVANQFRSLAQRDVLVAAQDVTANGGVTFSSQGAFLTSTEAGYRGIPTLARTGAFNGSNAAGVLSVLKANMTFTHETAYAYAAADVDAQHLRAVDLAGNNVPATGIHEGVAVYNHLGAAL